MKTGIGLFKVIPALLVAAMLFTGCDFFRSIVGKPTSKELEQMKIEAAEQARLQKQQDSIKKAQALQLEQERAAAAAKKYLLDATAGKYHVIIGSFKVQTNADNMFVELEKKGYTPRHVLFNNGFDAISVAGFDDYRQALNTMYEVMELPFCPEDVWIYDVAQNLHRTDYQNFAQ